MEVTKAVTFRASSIGDCLMGKHLLENIRAANPNARCAIVVASRGAMIRDLLAAYPWIEVIEANRRSPHALWRLFCAYRGSDFVCTPYTNGFVGWGTKLAARLLARRGALIGYTDRSAGNLLLYDRLIPLNTDRSRAPRLLEHDALAAAGVPVRKEWMDFHHVPQPALLPRLGLARGRYLVVGLFSGAEARGLSPERKQDLVDAIAAAFPGTILVFVGTKREQEQLQHMRLPQGSVVADTTVQEAAALIDQSAGMVSLGTGTSHMAALMRVPLVVLVACQGLQWVGEAQYGDAPIAVFSRPECCPGGHDYSTYGKCINTVDFDEVVARAQTMFIL